MSTQQDYEAFIAKIAEQTGIAALTPDADGLVSVRVEETYVLNLQYVEASSKILCFLEVGRIPQDAGAAVYRELLAAGLFGQETGGGYFALEPTENTVVYHYLFDFDPAVTDPEEFVRALEKILALADLWAGRLTQVTAEPAAQASGDEAMLLRP